MRIATRYKLWIDVTIFVAFLVLMQPALTGIPIHEWLATAAIAGFVVHMFGQWDWIIAVGRRFLARWERSRLSFVLDVGLLLAMTTVFVSGYAISRSVLPVLGWPVMRDFVWRRLHALSADATLVIVAVHVALHWRWIVDALRRYVFRARPGAQRAARQGGVATTTLRRLLVVLVVIGLAAGAVYAVEQALRPQLLVLLDNVERRREAAEARGEHDEHGEEQHARPRRGAGERMGRPRAEGPSPLDEHFEPLEGLAGLGGDVLLVGAVGVAVISVDYAAARLRKRRPR